MDVTFRVSNLFGRLSRLSLSADDFQNFRTGFVAIRQVLQELRSFEISFSNIQRINTVQGTCYQLWVITHEGNVQIRSFSTVKVLAFNFQFVARVKTVVLCILKQRQLIAGTMYDRFSFISICAKYTK
jgi:thymidylate synthase